MISFFSAIQTPSQLVFCLIFNLGFSLNGQYVIHSNESAIFFMTSSGFTLSKALTLIQCDALTCKIAPICSTGRGC
jgi:hypothetical protein